jgi:carbon monoxide dehydrogenase subunit G
MRFSGTFEIESSRERVWLLLTDPDAVGRCVPGIEKIETISPSQFRAVVRSGIGPVRGKFTFDVTWQEMTEPSHARMTARGKTMGSAVTVDSSMDLAESESGGCRLDWSADVVVHGMIASVGARLLEGFADKQTQAFFDCLQSQVKVEDL